jgi:hypothetical protein
LFRIVRSGTQAAEFALVGTSFYVGEGTRNEFVERSGSDGDYFTRANLEMIEILVIAGTI